MKVETQKNQHNQMTNGLYNTFLQYSYCKINCDNQIVIHTSTMYIRIQVN